MNHLSGATQQTASLSEELSATAEELSAQAAQLQDLMAFFQLADDGSAAPQRAQVAGKPASSNHALRFGQTSGKPAAKRMPVSAGDIDEGGFSRF
jgi:methyl-accepting chemotaxis protein